ncbi:MAG: hypothetical protein IJN75_01325, partial [Clostridia bacterium]|nr:hypothetical protein [Clostridia bacterium]
SLRNPSKLFVFFFPNGHSVAPWGFLFLQRKAPVGEKVCKRLWETLKKAFKSSLTLSEIY